MCHFAVWTNVCVERGVYILLATYLMYILPSCVSLYDSKCVILKILFLQPLFCYQLTFNLRNKYKSYLGITTSTVWQHPTTENWLCVCVCVQGCYWDKVQSECVCEVGLWLVVQQQKMHRAHLAKRQTVDTMWSTWPSVWRRPACMQVFTNVPECFPVERRSSNKTRWFYPCKPKTVDPPPPGGEHRINIQMRRRLSLPGPGRRFPIWLAVSW